MLRKLGVVVAAAVMLAGCSGVVAYRDGDQVSVGPLKQNDLNTMNASYDLVMRQARSDAIGYEVDPSGQYVAVCRTSRKNGTTTLRIFQNAIRLDGQLRAWGQKHRLNKREIGAAIDQWRATQGQSSNLEAAFSGNLIYPLCAGVGSGHGDGRFGVFLTTEPNSGSDEESTGSDAGFEGDGPNYSIVIDVRGGSVEVTDVEVINRRQDTPSRLVLQNNPSMGNIVERVNGALHINGSPVLLNGAPLKVDSFSYQFE